MRRLGSSLGLLLGVATSCAGPSDSGGAALPSLGGPTGGNGGLTTCLADQANCVSGCVYLKTDRLNCGTCGHPCGENQACVAGACTCPEGQEVCGTSCVDTSLDPAHCGGCEQSCDPSEVCSLGQCAAECAPGLAPCGSSCADLRTSPTHCGECDRACSEGTCEEGVCECGAGKTSCGGDCVDTSNDPRHCGSCASACEQGPCVEGRCTGSDAGGAGGGTGGSSSSTGGATGGGGGSGGSSASGSGATGGSDAPPPNGEYSVAEGAFVSVCDWSGYAWSAADEASSVEPADLGDTPAGTELCISGTVAPDLSYGGYALLGINIGQQAGQGTENLDITPEGTGITVDLANRGGSALRVRLEDSSGEENHRWCADYEEAGFIPWSAFSTPCGADSGEPYTGEPINAVVVMVPGRSRLDVSYDVCINRLACTEGTGGAGGTGGTGAGGSGGSSGSGGFGGGGGFGASGGSGAGGGTGGGSGGSGGVGAGSGTGATSGVGATSGASGTESGGTAGTGGTTVTTGKFVGNITTMDQVNPSGLDFATHWDQITPENAGKWGSVERAQGSYSWQTLDAIYDYAQEKGILFKQHTFIWGNQQPGFSIGESQVKAWMSAFCTRYPETKIIDVVNEPPPHTTPGYANSIGGGTNGSWQWIINAFVWAREACPNAILLLNDYNNIEWPDDNNRFINIVKTLQAANAPIDAIGAQSHDLDLVGFDTVKTLLAKLHNDTGLPVYITEYDISTSDDNSQLSRYQTQIPYLLEQDFIPGITIWGWIYGSTWSAAPESGLIRNGSPRPAMTWLMQELGRPAP